MKKILIGLTVTSLLTSMVLSPSVSGASEIVSYQDDLGFEMKILENSNEGVKYDLTIEGQTVEVYSDFEKQTFTITENNETVEYNVDDFASTPTAEEVEEFNKLWGPSETQEFLGDYQSQDIEADLYSLNYDSNRKYYGPYTEILGMHSAKWTYPNTYTIGGFNIQVIRGVQTNETVALKKFTVESGTEVVKLAAMFITYARTGNAVQMANLIKEVLEIVGEIITGKREVYFRGVKETVGRAFNVVNRGIVLKTKSYNIYHQLTYNNKSGRKVQSSGGYAYFFNDFSNYNAALVAYQQFQYIVGLRSTPPKRSEF